MKIGINEHIEPEIQKYYDTFYDILRTPNFDDNSRVLKRTRGIQTIGYSPKKRCRFCGKSEDEVSFDMVAHAFPESIGNHVLASNYECDDCNKYFGKTIENDYAIFFNLYHSIMQIDGKKGIPKCNFKVPCKKRTDKCAKYCVQIFFDNGKLCVSNCREVDKKYVNFFNNSITISKPVGKCCPIAVFKTLVKMAISVMPIEELHLFSSTTEWLRELEHRNFYKEKKLLVRYKVIPGFKVTKYPNYVLFRRKKDVWNKPYMLFNLTYGCYTLLIEVPRDADKSTNSEFEKMPFPPIPFYTADEGIWDLSTSGVSNNMNHSMVLNFDGMEDCTNNVEICDGKCRLVSKK